MRGVYTAIFVVLAVAASNAAVFSRPQAVRPRIWLPPPAPKNDIDNAIISALEALRQLMPKGIPELGVPVMEPLTVPHYDLNVDTELAKITASLDDLVIKNLSTFKIVKIANDLENLKADFDLSFERITLSGQYNMSGLAMGSLEIFGNGAFSLVVDGFDVGGTVYLSSQSGSKDSPAELDKLLVHFSVKGMASNFENLMGGGDLGELVNSLISESAPEFIKGHQAELSTLIADTVKGMVNPILSHYTLKDILDFLGVPN
ncbi:uncharacterized protein [Anabrus simplex]|uniref:uncharacterized protein n=1 Tax=Anabrus simplex TaxID=316456 RepID=UPI0035A3C9A4